jgi:hypothetical protein
VVKATQKQPAIKKLNNFVEGWDILRIEFLVDSLGGSKRNLYPTLKDLGDPLKTLRAARNFLAHKHLSPSDESPTDSDLVGLVGSARKYLPGINSLDEASSRDIYKKLETLELCTYNRRSKENEDSEDSDVLSHLDNADQIARTRQEGGSHALKLTWQGTSECVSLAA